MRWSVIWKVVLCATVFAVMTLVSGMLGAAVGLTAPKLASEIDPKAAEIGLSIGAMLLAIGVAPLAAGIGGPVTARIVSLFALVYLSLTINGGIEALIFTAMYRDGGFAGDLVRGVLPALAISAALVWLLRTHRAPERAQLSAGAWAWRIAAAILAWPAVYYTFGMMVGPFVTPHYDGSGPLGLVIPPQAVIIRTQLFRGAVFLAASLPALVLWTGTRRGFIGAMGLAQAAIVGWYGLSQASFFPALLRVLHGIEITADSFVYAAVLAFLFVPKETCVIRSNYSAYGRSAVPAQGR